MEYNHILESFYKNFGSNILLSFRLNYRTFFSYKHEKESKLSNALSKLDLSSIIAEICDGLIRNGESSFRYKLEKDEKNDVMFIVKSRSKKDKNDFEVNFTFPKEILTPKQRKNVITKLTQLNPMNLFSDPDNLDSMRFASEMTKCAEIEIGKIGNHYLSDNAFDYYSDFYCIYRQIMLRIEQRKLIDYVLETLNSNFLESLQIDASDVLQFNGKKIIDLKRMLTELKNNKPLIEISKELLNDSGDY